MDRSTSDRDRESDRPRRDDRDDRRSRDQRPRDRSRSPRRDRERDHDRSRDHDRRDRGGRDERDRDDRPRREERRVGGGSGFKWKQKRPEGNDDRDPGEKRLERGYGKRSRSPRRDRERNNNMDNTSKAPKSSLDQSVDDKFGPSKSSSKSTNTNTTTSDRPKPSAAPVTSAPSSEPMIIVNVNDRLGTKASIPCLASDPVKLFKAQVAARIGRQPHEILLKRQGERPFKDQLTLEDYGVSNGVQIDLEIDTGE